MARDLLVQDDVKRQANEQRSKADQLLDQEHAAEARLAAAQEASLRNVQELTDLAGQRQELSEQMRAIEHNRQQQAASQMQLTAQQVLLDDQQTALETLNEDLDRRHEAVKLREAALDHQHAELECARAALHTSLNHASDHERSLQLAQQELANARQDIQQQESELAQSSEQLQQQELAFQESERALQREKAELATQVTKFQRDSGQAADTQRARDAELELQQQACTEKENDLMLWAEKLQQLANNHDQQSRRLTELGQEQNERQETLEMQQSALLNRQKHAQVQSVSPPLSAHA